MNRPIPERLKWFKERAGKILFRNSNGCTCGICKNVEENGLLVEDEMHATYLYDNECDYTAEGTPLRYFDSKIEVEEWLKTLNKSC